MSVRPTYTTMGVSSPASVRDDADDGKGDGNYHYKRDLLWTPNDPRYYPERAESPAKTLPQNAKAMHTRAERIAEYGRLQTEEGLTPDQAADRVGAFGRTTRRTYEREFQEQQRRESRDG